MDPDTFFKSMAPVQKLFSLGSLIFGLVFGLIFTVVGLVFINTSKIDPGWTRTSGQIVDVDTSRSTSHGRASDTYVPVVNYSVDGQSYTIKGFIYTSSYPNVGGSREVAYNPVHPEKAKVVEGKIGAFMYIFPVIGIAVIGISLAKFFYRRKHGGFLSGFITKNIIFKSSASPAPTPTGPVGPVPTPGPPVQQYTGEPPDLPKIIK